jgi:putative transposase
MKYNSKEHQRRSIRLKEYDYSQNGAYFVTICTYHGQCIFGNAIDGIMRINKYERIVLEEWSRSEKLRVNIYMDYFVVMPNHLHGIIVINDRRGVLPYALQKQNSIYHPRRWVQLFVVSNHQQRILSIKSVKHLVCLSGNVIIMSI